MITICLGIYKLFELYARRRERIMIIEKMFERITDISTGGKVDVDLGVNFLNKREVSKFSSLRLGALMCGIGLGVILGHVICYNSFDNYGVEFSWDFNQLTYFILFASIIMCGGLGLLFAFIIEMRYDKKDDK